MGESLLSGFIYISIAAIVLSSVYLNIVHSASACIAGTLGAACNTTNSTLQVQWGHYANQQWSSAEIALWSVVGLAGIIALLYGALQIAGVV